MYLTASLLLSFFSIDLSYWLIKTSFKSLAKEGQPSYYKHRFTKRIVEEINEFRTNCLKYVKKIYQFGLNFPEEDSRVSECCNFLSKKQDEIEQNNILLEKLIFIDQLKLPFSKNDKLLVDPKYLKDSYSNFKEKFSGNYELLKFMYFKSSEDPEIAILSQIFEKFLKFGNSIFTPSLQYIGVNNMRLKSGEILIYIILAK